MGIFSKLGYSRLRGNVRTDLEANKRLYSTAGGRHFAEMLGIPNLEQQANEEREKFEDKRESFFNREWNGEKRKSLFNNIKDSLFGN